MLKVLSIIFIVIFVVAAIGIGLTYYGYSSVKAEFGGLTQFDPMYKADLGTILTAVSEGMLGNWLGAAGQFVEGVKLRGTLVFKNDSIVPVYIPSMEHKLYLGGELVGTAIKTPPMWIGPRGQKPVEVHTIIPKDELPDILMRYIFTGGNLDITTESTIRVGAITFTKTSASTAEVTNYVASAKSISKAEWRNSQGSYALTQVTAGTTVGLYVEVAGGDGEILEADIYEVDPMSPDDYVTTVFVEISNGKGLGTWAAKWQEDWGSLGGDPEYKFTVAGIDSSQLEVNKAVTPVTPSSTTYPLSVNFLGWYMQGIKVDISTKGQTVTAKLSLSGGSSGQYIMRIRRDISWSLDEDVNELSFNYDGISANKELSFTPPYATGEASTNGYFVYLVKNGTTIWSLAETYPPRLKVNKP